MSYKIVQDAFVTYQNAVKTAKIDYFAGLISRYNGNSRVLFNAINSVLNPSSTCSTLPATVCDDLLNFFVQKIINIRMQIVLAFLTFYLLVIFNQFSPSSLQSLSKIIGQLKATNYCHDIILSKIIKQTFDIIIPSLLTLVNISLTLGVFPASFKHAIVQALLKNII